MGIHRYHMRARFLRIEEGENVGQARLAIVGAHGEHQFGPLPVTRLGRTHGIAASKAHRRIKTIARTNIYPIEPASLSTKHGSKETEIGFRSRNHHDRIFTMRILRRLDKICNFIKRFVPGNGLELARSSFAYALKRGLYSPLPINVGYFRYALKTYGLKIRVSNTVWLDFDQAPITNSACQ